jgi:hypothetical protein
MLLLTLIGMAACGPTITDPDRLPDRVTACGWDWGHDSTIAPKTHAEIADEIDGEPPLLDLASLLCPKGACTSLDVRAGALARGACEDRIWIRVGWDSYAQYGMLYRL